MTTTTTTPLALAALCDEAEALHRAATPGPWQDGFAHWGHSCIDAMRVAVDQDWAQKHGMSLINGVPAVGVVPYCAMSIEDAAFIAASRRIVPALAAAIRSLTAERDALRVALATSLHDGFNIAEDHAEVSTWDGWHVTDPRIDWHDARKALEDRIAALALGENR